MNKEAYKEYGISDKIIELSEQVEKEINPVFKKIDEVCEYNTIKVLKAFQDKHISDMHFGSTTGYGYGDIGRDTTESVFSQVLKAEDSIVRGQFISGTHALTVTLFALLRPGDTLLSITGKPYDTLDEVIGIVDNPSSLKSYQIQFEQIDLKIDEANHENDDFDYEAIQNRLKHGNVRVIEIQRSKGYSTRKSISIEQIEKVVKCIRTIDKDVIIMVDNCYCEFVGTKEPLEVGADIIVGSLIKNLGGGIAPNGAYVAGRKDLIELVGERLTAPGEGKEVGPTLGITKSILQGLFMAPHVVASSLKTAVFASRCLEKLGFDVSPKYDDSRADIVQLINFNDKDKLIKYCQGIQMGSPVDSNSIPEPWDMPGYVDQVIMAAGAFTQGSSIELSCDGPIRPPYTAFMQGGLTYHYGKIGVMKAIENVI